MIQIDLEKAFDRVVHDVIFLLLEHVKAGAVITDGVRMVYKDCTAKLVINRKLGASIKVESSVKQGCCLSPLLFALYLEPFCLKIIKSQSIRGFIYAGIETRVLAYADDVAIFCRDTESVNNTMKEVVSFCAATGSVVSWTKCLGLWHGSWTQVPEYFCNMNWSVTPGKYLGVPLQHYRDSAAYWIEEVKRVKDQTEKWGGHNFSMFSRASVCNLFLVTKVYYVLQVLCMARISVQKLHRVFAVYIWGSTWERTSRCNLFHSVKNGGLGLTHLFLKQIVSRFFFLRDQSDIFLRTVIQVRLSSSLPEWVVSSTNERTRTPTGFLREVVMSFSLLKAHFSNEFLTSVTRKKLYSDLVDVFLPHPVYRMMYNLGPERNVLKRVRKMPVRSSAKTFFFQLHSGTLLVKPWLQSKGFFVPWSVNCIICKKPETIEHIFLDCHDSVFLWDVLKRTLKKDLPLSPFGIRFLPCADTGECRLT